MQEEKIKYYLDLIDSYLDGSISSSLEEELKDALKENGALKEIADKHILARANIRLAGEKDLKEKFNANFKSIDENQIEQKNLNRSFTPYYLFAFILVSLVITVLFFLNKTTQSESPLQMASDIAFVEDPSYDLFRSADSSSISITWDNSVAYFAAKDYSGALGALEGLSADSIFLSRHSGKLFLMKGVSFMKLEQYVDAKAQLIKISLDNPYYDQAEWYLAITYFHNGENDKAISRFSAIKNNITHYKRAVANEYLESLKNK